jgi:hypothetical protein
VTATGCVIEFHSHFDSDFDFDSQFDSQFDSHFDVGFGFESALPVAVVSNCS